MKPFRFGYAIGRVKARSELEETARRLEAEGWSSMLVSDHLGSTSSFPPLLVAASATSSLRIGNLVLNNDFFHPLRLAQEASTIDLLTDGRLELGLGSGWNRPEYEVLGVSFDSAARRGARLADAVREMKRAWAGEVTVRLGDSDLPAAPPPVQQPHPPLLIGGQGDAVLTLAAKEADIVGFTGIASKNGALTIEAGSIESLQERRDFVFSRAGERAAALELNVLVQQVSVGARLDEQAEAIAAELEVSPGFVAESPLVLAGTASEIEEKLRAVREQTGISYFSVSRNAIDDLAPVVAALAGT